MCPGDHSARASADDEDHVKMNCCVKRPAALYLNAVQRRLRWRSFTRPQVGEFGWQPAVTRRTIPEACNIGLSHPTTFCTC
jgi:hypothetical protein